MNNSIQLSVGLLLTISIYGNWLGIKAEDKNVTATDRLAKQLASDSYVERKHVKNVIQMKPILYWKALKTLAAHEDIEVQNSARKIIMEHAEIFWSRLNSWHDSKDIEATSQSHAIRKGAIKMRIKKWRTNVLKQIQDGRDKLFEQRLRVEKSEENDTPEIYKNKRSKYYNDREVWRKKANVYFSQNDQYQFLLENNNVEVLIKDTFPKIFEPCQIPFHTRKRLPVSFKFFDTPLSDALVHISDTMGIKIICNVETKDDQFVNLKVSNMKGALALNWVLRLGDPSLTYYFDPTKESIVICPKKQATPKETNQVGDCEDAI